MLTDAEKRALPGELFVPGIKGAGGWRAPAQGSFDELVARHAAQTERVRAIRGRGVMRAVAPPSPPLVFRNVDYSARGASHQRPVHAFALVDEDGRYRSFDPRQTIEVAAWLRHAAHEMARSPTLKLDRGFIEGFVCGHGDGTDAKNDRFSYLPLPTISAKGRDGRIRRVLVVEPLGGGGAKALVVTRRLGGALLVAEGTGEVMADLRAIGAPHTDGVARLYLSESRRWGSVTPMVLPGRDDRRSRKAHALVLKALAQAGYVTPVEEIYLQAEPVFPGAEMAGSYRVPAYLKPYPRTHAIITFAEPTSGPISIGAGRHVGLGVFAILN